MLGKLTVRQFIFLFTVLLSDTVSAQGYNRTTLINSDKGLSQNSVYSICKDSKGFIWLGTGDGLNRYDGKEFLIFRNSLDQKSSLDGFTIKSQLYEDARKCLWFSTENDLVCFDPAKRSFTNIVPFGNNKYRGNKVIISLDSSKNLVWFLTSGFALYNYNYISKKFNQFDFPVQTGELNPFLNSVGIDNGRGSIWITASDGLYRFNKDASAWTHEIKWHNFLQVCRSTDGSIWLLNQDSVFKYEAKSLRLSHIINSVKATGAYYSMTADNKNNVWIGTLDGKLFNAHSGRDTLRLTGDLRLITGSENVEELHCVYYDPSGLLWIGTEGGGVVKFDLNSNNFNNFPSRQSPIPSIYAKSFYSDNDSTLWIGTFKEWIYLFDPYTRKISRFPIPENKYFRKATGGVFSITKDTEEIYWIGYDGIVIAYNKSTRQFFFHPIPLSAKVTLSQVNQIRVEKGYLMVSTFSGLYKVTTSEHGKNAHFELIFPGSVSESIRTRDGSLWVSSQYEGLINISENGKAQKKIADNTGIRCIIEDATHQIIWAATQSGLLAYHQPTGQYRFYGQAEGLINPYLYGIIRTKNELWVSSNGGIAKGSVHFKNGNIFPDIYFKCYTKESGLQSDEFNTGAYCTTENGTIFFGGINGINWFKPNQVVANTHKPSVAITGLKINDSIYDGVPAAEFLKSIATNYHNNTFLIKFIGLEFHNPEGIRYRFKLEGLDKKWTEEKTAREVRYANLPPGDYTFRLFSLNSDEVLSNEVRLAIQISPPFYKTWWFIFSMVSVLVFLIVIITKYISQIKLKNRIRILEKEKAIEEERHRISKEMHDDLGAGLTQISLISEAAKRRNRTGNFPQQELNDIADTSKQLIENVSEIIWAMNPDFDSLSGMIAYLREQIGKLLEYSGKEFQMTIPGSFEDRPLSNIIRKNIIMLVKEAVNNAIKHSKATTVEVQINFPYHHLNITICDDGSGFDVNRENGGNGLKNYKYRTGLLGGTTSIQSGEKGTQVIFDIPL